MSVYGTDFKRTHYAAFLGNISFVTFRARPLVLCLRECLADLPTKPLTQTQLHPIGVSQALLRPRFVDNVRLKVQKY